MRYPRSEKQVTNKSDDVQKRKPASKSEATKSGTTGTTPDNKAPRKKQKKFSDSQTSNKHNKDTNSGITCQQHEGYSELNSPLLSSNQLAQLQQEAAMSVVDKQGH